jgi:hypothetical protein
MTEPLPGWQPEDTPPNKARRTPKIRELVIVIVAVAAAAAIIAVDTRSRTSPKESAPSAVATDQHGYIPKAPPLTFTLPAGPYQTTVRQNTAAAAVLSQCDQWYRDQFDTGIALVGQPQINWWLSTRIGSDATPQLNAYRMAESVYPGQPPAAVSRWADDISKVPPSLTAWYNEPNSAAQLTDAAAVTHVLELADQDVADLQAPTFTTSP